MPVGDASLWKRGRGRQVEVEGVPVAVFRDGERWIAVDDTCPHMGASLADGRLLGGELQCSWHEWRYDTTTGRCPVRPWATVRVHGVAVRDGIVWVRLAPAPAPAPPERPGGEAAHDDEWISWDPARYFKKTSGEEPQGS